MFCFFRFRGDENPRAEHQGKEEALICFTVVCRLREAQVWVQNPSCHVKLFRFRGDENLFVRKEIYNKKIPTAFAIGIFGAATQIRTGDLILTKDVLYQLSHSSVFFSQRVILYHKDSGLSIGFRKVFLIFLLFFEKGVESFRHPIDSRARIRYNIR